MKFILLTLLSFYMIHPVIANDVIKDGNNEELIGLNGDLLTRDLSSVEYSKIENQIEALIKDYQKFVFVEDKWLTASEENATFLYNEMAKLAFDILSKKIYLMYNKNDQVRLDKILTLTKMSDSERIELTKKEILLNK